ncbi:replication enhancer protein [Cajanus scarabaeoides yellow mosaic virus]|uniref:Replication enhancer n=1 Tax=Cajanus scarabaeoides yellow mosaic virus TaxID=3000307 RepID=A0A9E8MIJ9_9GEMI|nr:replication enhancer protein [Cajanus scarabaeoides yellow mosaic virus]
MDLRTGELITASQANNGAYIWGITNPLSFKVLTHESPWDITTMNRTVVRIMFNHQLKKALGMHKCFLDLTIYHRFKTTSGRILIIFRNQLLRY